MYSSFLTNEELNCWESVSGVLFLVGFACWTVAYVDIIYWSRKYKCGYFEPIWAVAANFAWELYMLISPSNPYWSLRLVCFIWSFLDAFILACGILWGWRHQDIAPFTSLDYLASLVVWFAGWFIFNHTISAAGDKTGILSAWTVNTYVSAAYLQSWCNYYMRYKKPLEGPKVSLIASLKLVGTGLMSIDFYFCDDNPISNLAPLVYLQVLCFIIDLYYLTRVLEIKAMDMIEHPVTTYLQMESSNGRAGIGTQDAKSAIPEHFHWLFDYLWIGHIHDSHVHSAKTKPS